MTRPGRIALAAAVLAAALAGCAAAPPKKDLTAFRSADPRSILIVPVLNQTVFVNAPDYLLTTLPVPVAERGYYVFPVHLVRRLLEDDGLADAGLVHAADPAKLCALFGADSVLYVTIERWDAQYLVLSTNVTVHLGYRIRDCKTGESIWDAQRMKVYSSGSGQSSGNPLADLVVMAVSAAITRAAPNYMPLARQANEEALAWPGPGIPPGPYHRDYGKAGTP